LAREIAIYSELPVMRERPFRFAYFGGGPPSFISDKQLRSLIDRLRKHISWDDAEEVTFECEPGTLSEHKVAAIREIGVTRISLGVEHFDDGILEANGRAHLSKEVHRSYDWIRAAEFPQVNIDLIAGMVGETDEKWRDAVKQTMDLAPDSVTIYQMELPYNTTYSQDILSGGESPVAGWQQKRDWVACAFDQLASAGYEQSSAYTMVRKGPRSGFVYRDSLWRGADMIGAGVASFSHVGGVHFQNLDQFDDYVQTLRNGRLPISRALTLEPTELLIREMILQIKTGRLEAGYFRDKFGVEILTEFAEAFGKHAAAEMLTISGDTITLTPTGLLQADSLLPEFFLEQHRDSRYT
jgi:oxygen-independent coproporphyrinogen-3 oxidase